MLRLLAVGAVLALSVAVPWLIGRGRIALMLLAPLAAVATAALTAPASTGATDATTDALLLDFAACYAIALGCHAALALRSPVRDERSAPRIEDRPRPRLVRS